MMGPHFRKQRAEIGSREFPFERVGDAFVIALEVREPLGHRFQAREIVGRKHLALHNGEVYLDLVQPTRVHRSVHGDQPGIRLREAPDRTLASV